MDPYTLMIEAVGVAIAVIWMIVPAREFAGIFRRLRAHPRPPIAEPVTPGGFDVLTQRDSASRDVPHDDREGRPS